VAYDVPSLAQPLKSSHTRPNAVIEQVPVLKCVLHEALGRIEPGVLPTKQSRNLASLPSARSTMAKPYASRMPFPATTGQYYAVAIPVGQGGGLAGTSSGGVGADKIDMATPRRRNNSLPGQTTVPSFPGFRDEMAIQKPPPMIQAPSQANSSAAHVQAQSTLSVPTPMASKTPLPQLSSTLKGKSKARDTSTHSRAAGPPSESSRHTSDSNVISLLPAKTEQTELSLSAVPRAIGPPVGRKKQRRKWSIEETRMLVAGCNKVS
jgi:hypothetical protein